MAQIEDGDTSSSEQRRRGAPLWLKWTGGVIGALILAIVIFLWLFDWDWLRGPIGRYASARLHREVRIEGHLRVHLLTWSPSATIGGLRIANTDWAGKEPMADVGAITAQVKLLPLLRGQIIMPLLDIEHPNLVLVRDAKGRANWDFGPKQKNAKPFKLPPIQHFIINNGKLRMSDARRRLTFAGTVNSSEQRGAASARAFHLAGRGELNGKIFLLDIWGGPLINVRPDQPYPFDADVRAGDIHATAKGSIPKPFNFGLLDAALSVSGDDLNDLYYLTGLTFPNTPPYQLSTQLHRDGSTYDLGRVVGRLGGSDIAGHLKVETARVRPYMSGDLVSRKLDFKDLGTLFGAPNPHRAAAPKQKAQAAHQAATGRLLPDATLQVERIRAMDADVHYRATSVIAPGNLPLRAVNLGVHLDAGLLRIDPLALGFPQGQLAGNARLNARGATPVTDLDLRLSGFRLEEMFKGKGGAPAVVGTLTARAKLHGTGDSVHKAASTADGTVTLLMPHGEIRAALAELLGVDVVKGLGLLLSKNQEKTDVRCALADFRVRNGVMNLQTGLFDTDPVVARAGGTIDLRTEALNLTIDGKPKHFQLIRLIVPVDITGHLTSPAIHPRFGTAIAQGGIAVALGALINPLAAIIPFLDPGLAKDANCGAAITAAAQKGTPTKPVAPKPGVAHPHAHRGHR